MKARIPGRPAALALLLAVSGCSSPLPAACTGPGDAPRTAPRTAWVLDDAWHTAIALQSAEITGPLGGFRHVFPAAPVLLFGYGKRTWITARVETPSEILLGPFPGPAAMQVVGLRVPLARAYDRARVLRLSLTEAQGRALDAFIWGSFARGHDGAVRSIGPGLFPGSLFYGASQGYGLSHDCNRWTADALARSGLAVDPGGVILPAALTDQLARLPQACLAPAR